MIIKDVHRLLIAIGVSLYILSPAVTMLSLSHYYFRLSFLEVYFLPLSVNYVLPLLAQCTFHLTLFHQSASGNWVPMAIIIKGHTP